MDKIATKPAKRNRMDGTSRRYCKIDPRLWDDEKIAGLDPVVKLLWLYLLTGCHTTSLPGLWRLGPAEIAEGMRLPVAVIEAGLATLIAIGRVQRDVACRLIRVARAPRYNPAENDRVIQSWWRQWSSLPDCALRYEHIASLADGVHSPKVQQEWNATFGTVDLAAGLATICAESFNFDPSSPLDEVAPKDSETFPNRSSATASDLPLGSDLSPGSDLTRGRVAGPVPTVAPVEPAAPPPPPSSRPSLASADLPDAVPGDPAVILAELRRHGALAEAHTPEIAEVVLGRAIAGAKKLPWVAVAIAEAARDAAADKASGVPWQGATLARRLSRYVDRAAEPRPAYAPAGRPRAGRYNPPAVLPGESAADLEEFGRQSAKEREDRKAAEARGERKRSKY